MTALLDVRDLRKSFGGIVAVDGVSFERPRRRDSRHHRSERVGQVDAVQLHPGATAAERGEVHLDGREVTGLRPCDLNRLGVSRTFQLLQIFPQLTARENLILAGQEHRGTRLSRLFGPSRRRAFAPRPTGCSAFFRLEHVADEPAGGLSYGQQKLLDAAMAFMAGPAPCAARRAGRRRQSDHAGRACASGSRRSTASRARPSW